MEIYVERDGERHGPMSNEEFQEAVHSGAISVNDRAWHEEFDDWIGVGSMLATLPAVEVKKKKLAGPVTRVATPGGDFPVSSAGTETTMSAPVSGPAIHEPEDETGTLPIPTGHASGVASFHREKSTYETVDREDRIPVYRVRFVAALVLLAAVGSWFLPWFNLNFQEEKIASYTPAMLFADIEDDKIDDVDMKKLPIEDRTISRIAILRISLVASIAFTLLVGVTVFRAAFYPDDAFRGAAFLMMILAGIGLFSVYYTYDIHIDGSMYENVAENNKEMAASYAADIKMDAGFFVCLGGLLLGLFGLLVPPELMDTSGMELLRLAPAGVVAIIACIFLIFALGRGNEPFKEGSEPTDPALWRYMLEL